MLNIKKLTESETKMLVVDDKWIQLSSRQLKLKWTA